MKKSLLIKLISVVLISVFLLSYLSIFSAGAAQLVEDFVLANKVSSLSDNAVITSYDSFVQSDCIVNDGLTVVYGENINVETINQKSEKTTMVVTTDTTELKNTYMVLYMKNGDALDIEYVSVSYDNDVNLNNVSQFIDSQLSETNISNQISDFLKEQINSADSALNRSVVDNHSTASYTAISPQDGAVVERVRDTGYFIDNYVKSNVNHPVVIYKKNITYEAVYVSDGLEDSDTYYIVARVYITPGNAISSSLYSGVENDQYGDEIIVCGSKTQFYNLFSAGDGDYFIDMSPMNNGIQTDVSGQTIPVSLTVGEDEITLDFTVPAPSGTDVNMVTHFDADDISYVQFLTEKKFHLIDGYVYKPISTSQFYYNAYVYMSSCGDTLYTKAGTGIFYCFTNTATSYVFVGSAQEIYYEAG